MYVFKFNLSFLCTFTQPIYYGELVTKCDQELLCTLNGTLIMASHWIRSWLWLLDERNKILI